MSQGLANLPSGKALLELENHGDSAEDLGHWRTAEQ